MFLLADDANLTVVADHRCFEVSWENLRATFTMDADDFFADQQAKFDDDFEEEIYDEDKYDALNDETFGNDISVGDWESDHEKYARFDETTKRGWPDIEVNDDINSCFRGPLKLLPDLEKELRNVHTLDYDYQQNFDYQNNFNFVNQNMGINGGGLIHTTIPPISRVQELHSTSQNVFNTPHGFTEENGGHIDGHLSRPQPNVISSAINVADLEKQLIDAVKISPSYSHPMLELNEEYLPNTSYYNKDVLRYNLPDIRNALKYFPRNNINNNNNNNASRTPVNVKKYNMGYAAPNIKMKNYMMDDNQQTDYAAGFMTLREKHWLAGIQTIQFNNSNPLEEDYYFTMYQKRHYGSNGPKPNTCHHPDLHSRQNTSYTQLHFENSLGKVLIGSVITPRKMIDIETNDFPATATPTSSNRTVISQKNSKQILLEIEHMYIPLLKIEQTYYTIRNKSQALPSVQQYIDELTNTLCNHLHHLVSYVTVRKGKQLVHRILPHLKSPSFLWNVFFGPSICTIILKDNDDQLLLLFLPYIRQWIFCLCLAELNQIAEYLMKNLSFILMNVFGISVIANMIERAEEIRPVTEPNVLEQWSIFISNVIFLGSETTIQRPVIGLDKKIIEKHFLYLRLNQSISTEKKNVLIKKLSFLGDNSSKK